MTFKKILFSGALLAVGYKLFATAQDIKETYDALQFRIRHLRNFSIDAVNSLIKFTFDLEVINPTPNGIGDLFGFIQLKTIDIFTTNDIYLGTAQLPDKKLFVNGNSSQLFENITAMIPIRNLSFVINTFKDFPNTSFKFNIKYTFAGLEYEYAALYNPIDDAAMNGLNAAICTNRVKCPGITKQGKLKKGYRFLTGGAIKKV